MPSILLKLSEKEKKKADIAKAKSDADTWEEFFLEVIEDE